MRCIFPMIFLVVINCSLKSQDTLKVDSLEVLETVVVRAFEQNRRVVDVSAPVSFIGKSQLERFANQSILPAMNITPGVRMEERSPGSYRLNIRGSSLRSPFGVRNVKVYWNNIPFTDPGGNTYLNQLSYHNINSIEIIKGPASSIYGAGTGGAVILKSNALWREGASVNYAAGSFGQQTMNASIRGGNENFQNTIGYTHQESDGYRDQSAMRRDVITYETRLKLSTNDELNVFFLYGDLYYQTPGGLTLAQYNVNPKAARPAAGQFPSAIQAQAAIYQKTFLSGFSNNFHFSEKFQNSTSLYGAFSQIKNPAIRNYEKRNEPHFGGRTVFTFNQPVGPSTLRITVGGEAQKGFSNIKVYRNNLGQQDSLQTDDEVSNLQYFGFGQAELELLGGWIITAGGSLNKSTITFNRVSSVPAAEQEKEYKNEFAPRFSILKKLTADLSIYAGVSKGFSSPTLAELLPSTSVINTSLEAEDGINYDVGLKGALFQNKLFIDVNAFWFELKNTLAQRRDQSGADYFENAGKTSQRGVETYITWQPVRNSAALIRDVKIFASHTWHNFEYKEYKQINTDLSGNKLPSVAPHVFTAGLDIITSPGVYTNITYYYSDRIAMNDANTEFANSFNLLGARLGWKKTIGKIFFDIFGTVDNVFDVRYSLGNDINAAAGRYYNAAAGINYSAGVTLRYSR